MLLPLQAGTGPFLSPPPPIVSSARHPKQRQRRRYSARTSSSAPPAGAVAGPGPGSLQDDWMASRQQQPPPMMRVSDASAVAPHEKRPHRALQTLPPTGHHCRCRHFYRFSCPPKRRRLLLADRRCFCHLPLLKETPTRLLPGTTRETRTLGRCHPWPEARGLHEPPPALSPRPPPPTSAARRHSCPHR